MDEQNRTGKVATSAFFHVSRVPTFDEDRPVIFCAHLQAGGARHHGAPQAGILADGECASGLRVRGEEIAQHLVRAHLRCG